MTRIKIKKLTWQDWNREHIKKHGVSVEEVETAAKNMVAHKKGYLGRYVAIGRSGARILAIIVNKEKAGYYLVVTARDASKEERKKVYEKEKSRSNSKI